MLIKVLGPGCKKCHETEKVVREAVAEKGSSATVEYVTDIAEIAEHGIFRGDFQPGEPRSHEWGLTQQIASDKTFLREVYRNEK